MFEVLARRLSPATDGTAVVVAVFSSYREAKAHALALNCKPYTPFFYTVAER